MLDSRRNITLACALSALAGYVDGIGFLHLGGLFVSFMSGNSTRMGVSLAEGHWLGAIEALGLVALFVIGAAAGSLIVLGRGANRQPCCWRKHRCSPPRPFVMRSTCRMSRSPRSCWRWEWRTRCSRSPAAPASVYLRHRRAGQGRPTRSRGADRRRELGLGSESAVVGGAGGGFLVRCARLLLDQSRRDLVCRRCCAGVKRDRCRDNSPIANSPTALTVKAACPI